MSNCSCGKRLRTSIPCGARVSLNRTRKVSAMLVSDAPCQARLNGGDASAKLNVCADLLEAQLQRADRDQCVERAQMTHVPDAHELALHLILTALHRHAKVVAQVLDQLAAVETLGNEDAGNAGRGIVGCYQLEFQCGRGVSSRFCHQRMTRIDLRQTLGMNQFERFVEA